MPKSDVIVQVPSVVQRPEVPTVSFAPSQARQTDNPSAKMSPDPPSSTYAAAAAAAASKQGSTVQEPQGLQVGLIAMDSCETAVPCPAGLPCPTALPCPIVLPCPALP